jgi:hypothetical protein
MSISALLQCPGHYGLCAPFFTVLLSNLSAGRLISLVLASTAILGFKSRRDPCPRILFSPRRVRILEVGPLF